LCGPEKQYKRIAETPLGCDSLNDRIKRPIQALPEWSEGCEAIDGDIVLFTGLGEITVDMMMGKVWMVFDLTLGRFDLGVFRCRT